MFKKLVYYSALCNLEKCYYSKMTHFGNEVVSPQNKTRLVDSTFTKVAAKYDVMNDILSWGTHRIIKKYFVQTLHPTPNIKLLDVACGTGDIAFTFLHAAKQNEKHIENHEEMYNPFTEIKSVIAGVSDNISSSRHVVALDMNENMLSLCKQRAKDFGFEKDVTCVLGSAEALPFPDNTFDVYTIAFGIRNVTFMDQALLEAKRVLKKHGCFLCLEFSHVQNPLLSRLYDLHMKSFPCMGQLVSGNWMSYQYLVESIHRFPMQEEFQQRIEDAGFGCVTYENILNGIVAIHSAFKL